ncbi:MAG: SMC-Scp complex subunit ScpB [Candidatus Bathyarchaeia archaeon]
MEKPDHQPSEAQTVVEPVQAPVAEVAQQTATVEQPKIEDAQAEQAELAADAKDNEAQAAEKLKRNLALIEAALYVAGRPLDINELCQAVNSRSKKKVKKYAETVMQAYIARGSPMEILALKDERYVLQVKAEYTPLVKKLVNRPLLSSGPLKTLSYIAFRQPITQKRVVETRGQHAYGHVKLLKDMGLITSERVGRSMALKTTDYFADYFGLTQDTASMKRELRRIFGDALKDDGQP